MRGLTHDVLDRGAWKLAWLPPSLPYYETGGAYADPSLRDFTKRLIFSAWSVVPKAIAAMLSYEAERRAIAAAGYSGRRYDDRPITPPLQFRMDGGRPAGMPALALLYPGLTLARLGDPLEVVRALGTSMPLGRQALLDTVRDRIRDVLARLPEGSPRAGTPDQRWYWAAPFLLDRRIAAGDNFAFLSRMRAWDDRDDEDQESRLASPPARSRWRQGTEARTTTGRPRPSAHQDGHRRPRHLRPASPLPRDRRSRRTEGP